MRPTRSSRGQSEEDLSLLKFRYFQQGACQRGDSCIYSHNWSDKPSTVCVYYQRGNCSYGSQCRYDHVREGVGGNPKSKPKTPINQTYTQSEYSLNKSPGQSSAGSDLSSRMTSTCNSSISRSKAGCPPVPVSRLWPSSVTPNMVTLGKETAPVVKSPASQLSVDQWVNASEFVPGQKWKGISLPSSYLDAAKVGVESVDVSSDLSSYETTQPPLQVIGELCPFYAYGECRYGEQCQYIHGEICEMCQLPVLMPFDIDQQNKHFQECLNEHEKDMEVSFAVDRSKDKVCGVCMEVIWEKEPEQTRRFGILSGCSHVYCLDCIRKWRGAKQFENKVIRACPECRVKSDFVTPSKYWVELKEDKDKLIDDYKKALSKKPCKYFNQGKGECPFNNKCFYLHAYPDGRIASPRPWHRRQRQDADGETSIIGRILLSDFLDEFQENRRRRPGATHDEADEWETFFMRLQMLGIALPADDDDDDIDNVLFSSDYSSSEDSDEDVAPV